MLTAIGQLAGSLSEFRHHLLRDPTPGTDQGAAAAAVNALTLQWSDLTKALHEDAEFAAIFLRGVHSFNDLDAISKTSI